MRRNIEAKVLSEFFSPFLAYRISNVISTKPSKPLKPLKPSRLEWEQKKILTQKKYNFANSTSKVRATVEFVRYQQSEVDSEKNNKRNEAQRCGKEVAQYDRRRRKSSWATRNTIIDWLCFIAFSEFFECVCRRFFSQFFFFFFFPSYWKSLSSF